MNRSVTTSMKKGYIMKTGLEDVFASGVCLGFFRWWSSRVFRRFPAVLGFLVVFLENHEK
jgi:hypothetical protein